MKVRKVANEKVIAYDFYSDITKSPLVIQLCEECSLTEIFIEVYTLEKNKTNISEILLQMNCNMVFIPYKSGYQDIAIKTDRFHLPKLLEVLSICRFEEMTVWSCNESWEQHLFFKSARKNIAVEEKSNLYLCYNLAEKSVELYLNPQYDTDKIEQLIKEHAK
mgnify:CR=1 FL=1